MIATHNIKVDGRWVHAGEEYEREEAKAEAPVKKVEEPESKPEEKPAKEEPKAKTAPTRRKKTSG